MAEASPLPPWRVCEPRTRAFPLCREGTRGAPSCRAALRCSSLRPAPSHRVLARPASPRRAALRRTDAPEGEAPCLFADGFLLPLCFFLLRFSMPSLWHNGAICATNSPEHRKSSPKSKRGQHCRSKRVEQAAEPSTQRAPNKQAPDRRRSGWQSSSRRLAAGTQKLAT